MISNPQTLAARCRRACAAHAQCEWFAVGPAEQTCRLFDHRARPCEARVVDGAAATRWPEPTASGPAPPEERGPDAAGEGAAVEVPRWWIP